MALFERLHLQGNTIVLVTHEHDIAMHAYRIVHIRDGKVERDETIKIDTHSYRVRARATIPSPKIVRAGEKRTWPSERRPA
jgi:energy-coupling factor transporter ATP-binding protein EcfA2